MKFHALLLFLSTQCVSVWGSSYSYEGLDLGNYPYSDYVKYHVNPKTHIIMYVFYDSGSIDVPFGVAEAGLIVKERDEKFVDGTGQRVYDWDQLNKCGPGELISFVHNGYVCDDCLKGFYQDTPNHMKKCSECPRGYYQNIRGQNSCKSCPAGQYRIEPGETSCISCMAGYYQDQVGKGYCARCSSGQYGTQTGKTSCQDCPEGYFSRPDWYTPTYCMICSRGQYAGTGEVCKLCPGGYYQDNEGQGSCKICQAGQFSVAHISTLGSCNICMAGRFAKEGQSSCKYCPPGQIANEGQGSCASCLAGQFANEGQSSCTDCPIGQYGTQTEQTSVSSCQDCPAGQFANEGQSSCTDCPAGQYGTQTGQGSCKKCSIGQYGTQTGQTSASSCQGCPLGWDATKSGQTSCNICPSGWYGSRDDYYHYNKCFACDLGKYSIQQGQQGQKACKSCSKGQYRGVENDQIGCKDCPRGRYGAQTGQFDCTFCPEGQYGNKTGQLLCTLCPAGQYGTQTGQMSSSSCQDCPAGRFANAGQSSCTDCPAGQYGTQTGQMSSSSCQDCPAGQYGRQTAQSSCTSCPAGLFSEAGMSECKNCFQRSGIYELTSFCGNQFLEKCSDKYPNDVTYFNGAFIEDLNGLVCLRGHFIWISGRDENTHLTEILDAMLVRISETNSMDVVTKVAAELQKIYNALKYISHGTISQIDIYNGLNMSNASLMLVSSPTNLLRVSIMDANTWSSSEAWANIHNTNEVLRTFANEQHQSWSGPASKKDSIDTGKIEGRIAQRVAATATTYYGNTDCGPDKVYNKMERREIDSDRCIDCPHGTVLYRGIDINMCVVCSGPTRSLINGECKIDFAAEILDSLKFDLGRFLDHSLTKDRLQTVITKLNTYWTKLSSCSGTSAFPQAERVTDVVVEQYVSTSCQSGEARTIENPDECFSMCDDDMAFETRGPEDHTGCFKLDFNGVRCLWMNPTPSGDTATAPTDDQERLYACPNKTKTVATIHVNPSASLFHSNKMIYYMRNKNVIAEETAAADEGFRKVMLASGFGSTHTSNIFDDRVESIYIQCDEEDCYNLTHSPETCAMASTRLDLVCVQPAKLMDDFACPNGPCLASDFQKTCCTTETLCSEIIPTPTCPTDKKWFSSNIYDIGSSSSVESQCCRATCVLYEKNFNEKGWCRGNYNPSFHFCAGYECDQDADIDTCCPAKDTSTEMLCHPADSVVRVQHACRQGTCVSERRMDELKIDDMVEIDVGLFERIIAFAHRDSTKSAAYIQFTVGNHTLEISKGHYLYANGKLTLARDVQLGDQFGYTGAVTHIRNVYKRGIFHPTTWSATLMVDGVKTSTMTDSASIMAQKNVILPLCQLMYDIGKPVDFEPNNRLWGLKNIGNLCARAIPQELHIFLVVPAAIVMFIWALPEILVGSSMLWMCLRKQNKKIN